MHKRLGVENSQGVTPYSWRGLREKRQALGPAGFKRALSPGLLQKYLREPLLVDGRKTDLRCYVLIASVRPFAAFFYSEFVARVSPVVYAPTATDARAFTVGHFAKNKGASQGGKPQKLVNNTPDSTQMSPERLGAEAFNVAIALCGGALTLATARPLFALWSRRACGREATFVVQ